MVLEAQALSVINVVARALDAIGVSYTIISKGMTEVLDKSPPHRIEVLSELRNRVLGPLFDANIASRMPGGKFDEVLFINDIFWCAADLLEVLYQRRRRGAYQSCAVDWDWSMRLVYDRWVLRAMSGRYVISNRLFHSLSLVPRSDIDFN